MKPLNHADYPTYNIGDKVTIRQWDDMESEFGLNLYGNINLPGCLFTKRMKQYCGQTFPIVRINHNVYSMFVFYYLDGISAVFTSLMFEQSKPQSVPPSSLSFDSLLQGGDFF